MPPDFDELMRIDERALNARLAAVRAAIEHAGEKGRALEHEIVGLLRSILPSEYGLTTGFIAHLGPDGQPRLTSQLDIIVYDALRSGPLARLGSCDILPLEAAYGYMEVKARLRSSGKLDDPKEDSLEACIKKNRDLSALVWRWFNESAPSRSSGPVRAVALKRREWLRLRGYVVTYSVDGAIRDSDVLSQRMADVSLHYDHPTHLHGLFVVNGGYFRTRVVADPADRYHVDYVTEGSLAAFRCDLLASLDSYPRVSQSATPALSEYFQEPAWRSKNPQPIVDIPLPPTGEDDAH